MGGLDEEAGPQDPADLPEGAKIGRYIIVEKLGAGSSGVVYHARDIKRGLRVALKILRPPSDQSAGSSPEAIERLFRDAQVLENIPKDSNLAAVYAVERVEDHVLLVMELITGVPLSEWLRSLERPWREILIVLTEAGRGLAAAHREGIVHGNLKPHHILIVNDSRVCVIGFSPARPPVPPEGARSADPTDEPPPENPGLAPLEDQDPKPHNEPEAPLYWAPERHLGQPVDPRSDQYSYCVILHEAFFGQPPFDGATAPHLLRQKLVEQIKEPLWATRVPNGIRLALHRGLRAKPEERYPSMDALFGDLLPERRFGRRAMLLVIGVSGAIGLSAFVRRQTKKQKQRQKVLLGTPPKKRLTFTGFASDPVFSPDGARLAYISNGRYLYALDLGAADVTGPGQKLYGNTPMVRPRWLPGGVDIAFTSGERLDERYVISPSVNQPQREGELLRDTVSIDGSRAAGLNARSRELSIEDRRTGQVNTLHLKGNYRPLEEGAFSRAGDWLLLLTAGRDSPSIWLVGSNGAPERELIQFTEPLRWAAWSPRGDAIYALTFDKRFTKILVNPSTGELAGDPRELFELLDDVISMSLSRDGRRLVYAGGPLGRDLAIVTGLNPWGAGNAVVQRLTGDGTPKLGLCVSPDGLSIAYRGEDSHSTICTIRLQHPLNRDWVTCFGGRPVSPQIAWSPSGRALAFASPHEGTAKVFRIGADALDLRLAGGGDVGSALAWGPGQTIAYAAERRRALMLLDPDTGEEHVLAETPDRITRILASPNGKLLALGSESKDGRVGGLMVVGVDDGNLRLLAQSHRPVGWTLDSESIYSVSPAADGLERGVRTVFLTRVARGEPHPAAILPAKPRVLEMFSLPDANMRFLCEIEATTADLWMIENFDP